MSGPKGAREISAEARRRTIVAAASRLFFERGYHGTGIDDIAAAAGVAIQTIDNSMGSKRDVLVGQLRPNDPGVPRDPRGRGRRPDPRRARARPAPAAPRQLPGAGGAPRRGRSAAARAQRRRRAPNASCSRTRRTSTLIRRLLDDCPNIVAIKAEGGFPGISEFIPLAQVMPLHLSATSDHEYYGPTIPTIFRA
ncbi:MAG TPA: helix-turn-helix domain-containing protein [Gaiellaceae bacterium]|nr:helix-turn-helix domain-containing protein [Gaiellaceae bacterium]